MKRWLVWCMVALAVVAVGGGIYLGVRSARPGAGGAGAGGTSLAPATVAVTRGDVEQTVIAPGLLVGTRMTTLGVRASGRLVEINVRPGDVVQAGDELARLDISDLLKQIEQAQASLSTAELRLAEGKEALERQVAQASLGLDSARARLSRAEIENADAITRAEIGLAVAEQQLARLGAGQPDVAGRITAARVALEQAEEAVAQAQVEYLKALDRIWEPEEVRDAYARAFQGAEWGREVSQAQHAQALAAGAVYQHDLRIQELAIAQAEAELAELRRGVDPLLAIAVRQAELELDWLNRGTDAALVNEVDQARLALERLQAQADGARVVALADGVVLDVMGTVGETVLPGEGLILMTDPAAVEVRTTVIEEDLPLVQVGQPVALFFDAQPDAVIQGTVTRVVPQRVQGKDRPLYYVYVAPDGLPEGAVAGMTADASIVIARQSGVLRLPRALVLARSDRMAQVLVWTGDQAEERAIRVGLRGDVYVEILEGLREGELVVGQ
jgi:multidrug efflux pump subunit AcrA (membrane-fusion protein)